MRNAGPGLERATERRSKAKEGEGTDALIRYTIDSVLITAFEGKERQILPTHSCSVEQL